jgi:hypothetical protein
LPSAGRALFGVASGNVQVAVEDCAVVTRRAVRVPVETLGSIRNSRIEDSFNGVLEDRLGLLNPLGPALADFDTVVTNHLHGSW